MNITNYKSVLILSKLQESCNSQGTSCINTNRTGIHNLRRYHKVTVAVMAICSIITNAVFDLSNSIYPLRIFLQMKTKQNLHE